MMRTWAYIIIMVLGMAVLAVRDERQHRADPLAYHWDNRPIYAARGY